MNKPPLPLDEAARLNALRSLDILDTDAEDRFDRVTRLARRLFRVPIALVSLVDADRQWFKSRQGLDATETPRDVSFCGHAILGDGAFVVEDARADARFADNPLVTGDPHVRFYAGQPLRCREGFKIGTLCIIDRETRRIESEDLDLLRDLAHMVERELSAYELATSDDLTGLANRRGFEALAPQVLAVAGTTKKPVSLVYIDLDHFKKINDEYGHAEGDRALVDTSRLMLSVFRQSDLIARLGGDEFCVLMLGTDSANAQIPIDAFQDAVREHNEASEGAYALSCSIGLAEYDPERHGATGALMEEADLRMYEAKRTRRASKG